MRVNLIYAKARRGVIGWQGTMPWHLPEDLAHFKRQTLHAPVIMGRRTWDSIPERFRPLPKRTNVVITRQSDWCAPGAQVAHSLNHALELVGQAQEVWVIGGAQIYAQAEPLAQRVVVTEIDADFQGDAFAPNLSADWKETHREDVASSQGIPLSFVTLERVPPPQTQA
jgi:dihydrofolate reductase